MSRASAGSAPPVTLCTSGPKYGTGTHVPLLSGPLVDRRTDEGNRAAERTDSRSEPGGEGRRRAGIARPRADGSLAGESGSELRTAVTGKSMVGGRTSAPSGCNVQGGSPFLGVPPTAWTFIPVSRERVAFIIRDPEHGPIGSAIDLPHGSAERGAPGRRSLPPPGAATPRWGRVMLPGCPCQEPICGDV